MKYITIKNVKNPVSQFVFGTAITPMLNGEDATEMLDAVFAAGINTFDTALYYQNSEISLGNWIEKRGVREKVNILTKGCHHNEYRSRVTPFDLQADVADSLKKLQIDYIDLYLLHRDDPAVQVGPIVETLNELCVKGVIGAFGGSNWTHHRIEEANEYAEKHSLIGFTVSSPCFSLAEQIGDPWTGSVHISGPSNKEARDWYLKHNMPVFAYSSLARGYLSGKYKAGHVHDISMILNPDTIEEYYYPENEARLIRIQKLAEEKDATVPQIVLAWTLAQNMTVLPILSPSSKKHLTENLKAFDLYLSQEECEWLDSGEMHT